MHSFHSGWFLAILKFVCELFQQIQHNLFKSGKEIYAEEFKWMWHNSSMVARIYCIELKFGLFLCWINITYVTNKYQALVE